MSGVLGTRAYQNYFNNPVSYAQGGITAAMPAGSLVGSLGSSFIADKYSRKFALQVACVLWVIGAIIQCASINRGMLCAGRVIGGMSIGIASSIVPVYQSEIAPKEIRGRVVSLQQWAITWGILIQYFIQYGASNVIFSVCRRQSPTPLADNFPPQVGGGPSDPNQPTSAFRIPWGVQMFPAVILFVGLFFLPYSPRWLASKDRWEEALQVLASLHDGDPTNPRVLAQYQEIKEALEFERTQAISSYKALVAKGMFKRVLLGMSVQAWSQLCGMNIMMYYIVYIMQGAGIGSAVSYSFFSLCLHKVNSANLGDFPKQLLTASIQYVINVVMTLPAIVYLDKFGRRPALVFGAFMMMTWLFIVGALQQYYGQPNTGPPTLNDDNRNISWIVYQNRPVSSAIVACSYLFVATFATTWGPVSWTYPAEIFPSKIRAKAVSLTTATNWFWNCVLAFAVPPLLWNINFKMYYVFGAFNAAAFVHMALMAPETKGFTLEEMDDVFNSGMPAWKKYDKGSKLEQLEREIQQGHAKVGADEKVVPVHNEAV